MIGTTKRRPRSLALAGAVLLAVMILGWPAIAQERPLSAWRLNEWSTWESLPEVNPYATITGLGSGEGWGNSGASIGVTARAVFEPDLSRAEISAEFVPTSRAIITSDPRLFIAPLRQRLEWKVIVTVRNPNDVAMTNARVHNQFGKAFRATLTGQSVGNARMADADVKGLLPSSSGLTWDIGYLGPGDAAKAELTIATNQAGGRAEFDEEGVYSLDTGFQLTYRLLGKHEVRNTAPCSVIARVNPSALRPDGEPYTVQQKPIERDLPLPERPVPVRPGTGGSVPIGGGHVGIAPSAGARQVEGPAQILRVHRDTDERETGLFKLLATGVSENIAVQGGKFRVPPGQSAEWRVTLDVENTQSVRWNDWVVTLTFGPWLSVSKVYMEATDWGGTSIWPGELTLAPSQSGAGGTDVTWEWKYKGNKFNEGSTAQLVLKVTTVGLPTSTDDLVFCNSIQMTYNPRAGGHGTVNLDDVYTALASEPYAYVSLSATRLDWRVQKPGVLAVVAAIITASGSGTGTILVQFDGFGDLIRTDGDGVIPVFYGLDQNRNAVEEPSSLVWMAAAQLNGRSQQFSLADPIPIRVWSMIRVDEQCLSAEYENAEGVITFIMSNQW
jgi:hypothetical protein